MDGRSSPMSERGASRAWRELLKGQYETGPWFESVSGRSPDSRASKRRSGGVAWMSPVLVLKRSLPSERCQLVSRRAERMERKAEVPCSTSGNRERAAQRS
jgi:hypothetical protein